MTYPHMSPETKTTSPRRLVTAVCVAALAAVVVLLTAVLPAEYGIDPLGVGKALGLVALSEVRAEAIAPQAAEYKVDTVEFVLRPFEFVEYKYRLARGGSMVFSWEATGNVNYDMHSEPDGAPRGYAESFDKQQKNEGHGTFIAPFPGIHGWYWENREQRPVTVRLNTAGFYTAAQEFFNGGSAFHELSALPNREGGGGETK
jgi:hypothetical protein